MSLRRPRLPPRPASALVCPSRSLQSCSVPLVGPRDLEWGRQGCGLTVALFGESATPQGREGRTMFFRVGEEMDHPAQEGADGGLAPGPRAGARFPPKDLVLLEGILVT